MGTDNLRETTEQIAAICQQKNIQCICICTKKEENQKGISALLCGNQTEIITAIIKAMNVDDKLRAILEVAVEQKDIFQAFDNKCSFEKLFKNIFHS